MCAEIVSFSPRGHAVFAASGGRYHGDSPVLRENACLYPRFAGGRSERQGTLVEVLPLQRLLRGHAGLFKALLGLGSKDSEELAGGISDKKNNELVCFSVRGEDLQMCIIFLK